jgi:hypothetical protein
MGISLRYVWQFSQIAKEMQEEICGRATVAGLKYAIFACRTLLGGITRSLLLGTSIKERLDPSH